MKITPPYPDYPYFRKPVVHFCAQTLCDLSILSYGKIAAGTSSIGPFRFVDFLCARDTQALVVVDDRVDSVGALAIVFRGTEPYNLRDWATDLDCDMDTKVGVHDGFLNAYRDIEPAIQKYVRNQTSVFLTGHSLGAALATVAARFVDCCRPRLVTFGSPRVGDPEFVAQVNVRCCAPFERYVHGRDIVVTVPPEKMGYMHVTTNASQLKPQPRPWRNILVPRAVFDHVPVNYGDALWRPCA